MSDSALSHRDAFQVQAAVGWLELGSAVEARLELAEIAPLLQEHPDVLEVWWRIFAEEQHWTEALVAAEKVSTLAPDRESGWIEQSYALHELGRTGEAYERLVAVVEKFPQAFVIPYNLACYQCRLGDKVRALHWLRSAVQASDAKTIRAMALDDSDLAPLRHEIVRLA